MLDVLYLNNRGDKWIVPGEMRFLSLEPSPRDPDRLSFVFRTADYFKAVGNFAAVVYRVRGKRCSAFFNDFYKCYHEPSRRRLPIVDNSGLSSDAAEVYMCQLGATIE